MKAKKILIIGMVWPEPTSSAAGTRMVQLIDFFLTVPYQITFACAATKSDYSANLMDKGLDEVSIKLNDESFDHFIKTLQPDIVLYDRFMIEEQYGWRVQKECPNAIQILDTEDLHFLRQARQEITKKNLTYTPDRLLTDVAKREIASILRCDLSLIISEVEYEILQDQFKIDKNLLYFLPFLEQGITNAQMLKWLPFDERKDFMFIGNFLHEPNWHTVQFLKKEIWPKLRKELPGVSLHIYGAYPSQKVLQLDNKAERFFIKGRAADAQETMSNYRILLAPIQFGAGVKGKFIDAFHTGTPSVTTSIGAEAMKGALTWNGYIEDDVDDFIAKAVKLYQDAALWKVAQENGVKILNQKYQASLFCNTFLKKIEYLHEHLASHRAANFLGQILKHHSTQSTKYMSLWIQEKNKTNENL